MSDESAPANAWIEKAEHDYRTAIAALAQVPSITDTAGFHIQQAIEKPLKAFLVSRGVDFERVHDLEMLCDSCAQYNSVFLSLRSLVAPLTAYAVRFRYPGSSDPPIEKVRSALLVVDEVRRAVIGCLSD